nr:MAG TPA: hypothetical protein [Caudoviricetes sp.]
MKMLENTGVAAERKAGECRKYLKGSNREK